ncbi:MAG: TetR/AcrR family transcriptional regulator [Cytophagales bacterium]|nr:MAG: TetR/AcrR family transcriptional regulator [Cytophagales bacterium]
MSFAIVKINVNEKLYLRDPEQTQLGKKIINQSIRLIDELGFEAFTFKKLANRIDSTEASIYRYFTNKHNLLVYLVSWYWGWLEYQIDYQTHNVEDSKRCLQIAIKIISEAIHSDSSLPYINEAALHRIVVSESSKAYYTKNVDSENTDGFFRSYKSLCAKISDLILSVKTNYPYAHALSSTLLESAHQQVYFAQHLPSLTEVRLQDKNHDKLIAYLEHLAFTQLSLA